MPEYVKDFREKICEAVEYVSYIISDAEDLAVKIAVPRREMLFIFIDQCLGRCECASREDRTALMEFLAEREKAFQGDLSARMDVDLASRGHPGDPDEVPARKRVFDGDEPV